SAKLFFPLGNVLSIITIFIFKAEQMESGSNLTQTTSGRRSISLKRVSKNSRTNSKIKPVFSSNGKNGDKGDAKIPQTTSLISEEADIMKNGYQINGKTTHIYVENREGELFRIIVDTKKLSLLKSLVTSIHGRKKTLRGSEDMYPKAVLKDARCVSLHEVITGEDTNFHSNMHYMNGEPFDLREEDLTVVSKTVKGLEKIRKHNTGYKGVYPLPNGKFFACFNIQGQR